jgi:hypothetical protein
VKDENVDLLADLHNIVNRCKSYFSQFLNVHSARDVRQKESHKAELFITLPSPFEFKIAIARQKKCKLSGNYQIPAELFQGQTLRSENHKLISSIWNKEQLPDQWKESIIVLIHKRGNKTDCKNYHTTAINFIQNCVQYPSVNFKSMYR